MIKDWKTTLCGALVALGGMLRASGSVKAAAVGDVLLALGAALGLFLAADGQTPPPPAVTP